MDAPDGPSESHAKTHAQTEARGTEGVLIVQTVWIIVQMIVISAGLVAVVGAIFYAFCWTVLLVLPYFPLIGKRHRHRRWEEMNRQSGRR